MALLDELEHFKELVFSLKKKDKEKV